MVRRRVVLAVRLVRVRRRRVVRQVTRSSLVEAPQLLAVRVVLVVRLVLVVLLSRRLGSSAVRQVRVLRARFLVVQFRVAL